MLVLPGLFSPDLNLIKIAFSLITTSMFRKFYIVLAVFTLWTKVAQIYLFTAMYTIYHQLK